MADANEVRDFHGRGLFSDGQSNAVPFFDANGKLVTDASNLSYNDSTDLLTAVMNSKPPAQIHGVPNLQFASVVTGTDTAFATAVQFVSSVFLPCQKNVRAVRYLVGSVGGTDLGYAVIYGSGGTVVGQSPTAAGGVTVGAAAGVQTFSLQATVALAGPAMYYVGVQANGATAKLRTVPANQDFGIYAGQVSQTHGAIGAISAPTTFTAGKAPYVVLE